MTSQIKTGDISGRPAQDAPGGGKGASRAEAETRRDDFREALREGGENNGKTPARHKTADTLPGEALREGREKTKGERSSAPSGKDASWQDKLQDTLPDDTPPPAVFSGDALLRGLGASYAPLEAAPATGMASDASSLAAELAESILVNTQNRAEGEVRISLKEGVLPDTKIIIRREGDQLLVQIVSGNVSSLETLRAAQQDLQDRLAGLGLEVSVDLRDSREDAASGRSRGLDYFGHMDNES